MATKRKEATLAQHGKEVVLWREVARVMVWVWPWLGWLAVGLAGLVLHGAWPGWWTGGPIAAVGAGLAVLSGHLTRARRSQVARWMAPLTLLAASDWLAVATGSWPAPTARLWGIGGAGTAMAWSIWLHVHDGGDESGLAALWEKGTHKAGVDTARVPAASVTVSGSGPKAVLTGIVEHRGKTHEQVAKDLRVIESGAGLAPGSLNVTPHNDDAGLSHVTMSNPHRLEVPMLWPGPSRPGQSIAEPLRMGYAQDGTVFDHKVVGFHAQVQGMTGSAKAGAVDTPVPTPSGWSTLGEIRTGDLVFDEAGRPCRVLAAHAVLLNRPCYRVEFSDGSRFTVDGDHLWLTDNRASRLSESQQRNRHRWKPPKGNDHPARSVLMGVLADGPVTTTRAAEVCGLNAPATAHHLRKLAQAGFVAEQPGAAYGGRASMWGPLSATPVSDLVASPAWRAMSTTHRPQQDRRVRPQVRRTADMATAVTGKYGAKEYSVRVAAPLTCPPADLPIPPYTLGAWLGDGDTSGGAITSMDPEIPAGIEAEGLAVHMVRSGGSGRARRYRVEGLTARLRSLGVRGNKHIPVAYQRAAEPQRRALLAGLLDTDGSCGKTGGVTFTSTRERLARDVLHLVSGLGYKASLRSAPARLYGKDCGTCWTVSFTPPDKVFHLPRKLARQVTTVRASASHRYITAITPVPSVPVRCLTVDSPNHLYLIGETCVPTHNTTGWGWNEIGEAITRPDAAYLGFDITKGRQFLGPCEVALHGLATEPEQAVDLQAGIHRATKARTEALADLHLTDWEPGCGLSYLVALMEEAPDIIDLLAKVDDDAMEHWLSDVKALRTGGGRWVISLQRADWTQMPTIIRDQVAFVCFGVRTEQAARFGLTPYQLDNGCSPEMWSDAKPGMFYIDAKTVPQKYRTMPHRAFLWPDAKTFAAHCAQFPASARPMDHVTRDAIWPAPAAPPFPVPGPHLVPDLPTEPGGDTPDEEGEEMTTVDDVDPSTISPLAEAAAMPDVVFSTPGPERERMSPDDARRYMREWLTDRFNQGEVKVTMDDLLPLLDMVGRARPWLYDVMEAAAAQGLVRKTGMAEWTILQAAA